MRGSDPRMAEACGGQAQAYNTIIKDL